MPLWGVASGLVVSVSLLAAPATVVMVPVVPVRELPSVPVTVTEVPAAVLGVNVTVATPELFVAEVGLPKEPPAPPVQVTTWPAVPTKLLFTSASCAVIVTDPPAATEAALEEARYFVGVPGVVAIAPLVPVIAVLSVAVTACVV